MPAPDFKSVDQYIAAQPPEVRDILEQVRAAIRTAIPKSDEIISYKIPAYRLPGGAVIYFAGWKKHWSLYPITDHVVSVLGDAFASYEVEKGTVRFPFDKPVPAKLVARIARLRAKQIAGGRPSGKSPRTRAMAAAKVVETKAVRPRRSPAASSDRR